MKIPFVDLQTQYRAIQKEIDEAIHTVIDEASFVGGRHVGLFEQKFADMYGVKHCISCGNGTDSLYILYRMLGIGPGDEVITVANS
ncbi:MAG TPA: DegT/DnrJ/EryC1/StrS family aminotransferase, partial [Chryseosolibacter sp.]|nr:DegT/DnrJ/EryC1/StrS family aminotransferase [Chryseosolibacter sp.]